MKKIKDYIIVFLLLGAFIMTFKYSSIVKASVLDSIELWLTSLVPAMLPAYFLIDLLINYGLLNVIYGIFKSNRPLIFFISLISGTPTNVKYIKEFYEGGYIGKNDANFLLLFSYSPSPLFIFAFAPDVKSFIIIMSYLYLSNLVLYLAFRKKFGKDGNIQKSNTRESFINCLMASIAKSFGILTMILGVIIFFGLLNSLLAITGIDSLLVASFFELTNALYMITLKGGGLLWMLFAIVFGGLSIHTQIKSILEDTDISYRYFFIGRLLAALPILIVMIFY